MLNAGVSRIFEKFGGCFPLSRRLHGFGPVKGHVFCADVSVVDDGRRRRFYEIRMKIASAM